MIALLFVCGAAFAQLQSNQTVDVLPTHGIPHFDFNKANKARKIRVTPTKLLKVADYPNFVDDLDFSNLDIAINRQLARWRRFPARGHVKYGKDVYPVAKVAKTLREFSKLARVYQKCLTRQVPIDCQDDFNSSIERRFKVYVPNLKKGDPRFGQEKDTFFTGYFSPTLEGSKVKTPEFKYGIYTRPAKKSLWNKSRNEILYKDALEGKGVNLFYVKDAFELYLLQVQGGGKVIVDDNGKMKSYYILYNGTNKRSFRFISKYMKKQGYISDLTIESQQDYLLAHPEKEEEIYNYCPSYVYYKIGNQPPTGSRGVSVTAGRSIATDYKLYSLKGTLAFVKAERPTEKSVSDGGPLEFKEFSRFVLDQDTGGAIKGKGRVDFYHGEDEYAAAAAYSTAVEGNIFHLMLK